MTVMDLPKSSQIVSEYITSKGYDFEVVVLDGSARTAQDAANILGCEVAQICKSIIFKTRADSQPVLVLASGINRIDEKLIEQYLGEKIKKADADFTREVTGYAIGGIPPIAHQKEIPHIFIDEDLEQYKTIWAAAGRPECVFELNYEALVQLSGGKVVTVKKSS